MHSENVDFLRQIKIKRNSNLKVHAQCNGGKGGYAQYEMSFLKVPVMKDYGEASSDDLSSEWDSDQTESKASSESKVSLNYSTKFF